MLTLTFGIWASEPPLEPGKRLKRPGLIGLKWTIWKSQNSCLPQYCNAFRPGFHQVRRPQKLDIKSNYKRKYQYRLACPFCRQYNKQSTHHILSCNFGLQRNVIIEGATLISLQKRKFFEGVGRSLDL